LLSADLEVPDVKEKIVSVVKYFRNKQLPAAWYKNCGGTKLVMPQEVRWNTVHDCIQSFLRNRGVLVQDVQDHNADIDPNIADAVNDVILVQLANQYLSIIKPIAIALDRMQSKDATIAVAVEVWAKLEKDLCLSSRLQVEVDHFTKRCDMALGPVHYLANVLDHRFRGMHLTDSQKSTAYQLLNEYDSHLMPIVFGLEFCGEPFPSYLFTDQLKSVSPLSWWKVALSALANKVGDVKQSLSYLTDQLLTATASSAGLERIFSSFGLVQSKLRNRLGNEKAAKLTFMFKSMNQQKRSPADQTANLSWVWEQDKSVTDSADSTASNNAGSQVTPPEPPPVSRLPCLSRTQQTTSCREKAASASVTSASGSKTISTGKYCTCNVLSAVTVFKFESWSGFGSVSEKNAVFGSER
jgi:hypothetical protein